MLTYTWTVLSQTPELPGSCPGTRHRGAGGVAGTGQTVYVWPLNAFPGSSSDSQLSQEQSWLCQ